MNCPSRNDDVLLHPGWNQNPPHFAADLTTCQDLNGIANARELGDADCLSPRSRNLVRCSLDNSTMQEADKPRTRAGKGVKCPQQGYCTHSNTHNPIRCEHHGGLSFVQCPSPLLISWVWWLASVLITSILVASIHDAGLLATMTCFRPWFGSSEGSSSSKKSISHLRSRDTCGSGVASPDYDLPFHVGGLFIILFVSSSACAFPILVTKFPRLRIPASFLFSAKHFGTGVLIATAFVHLLPTAFLSLSNPCLSKFWTTDYPAVPGAIMLASIFFVSVIEMVFSPNQHVCGGNEEGIVAVSRKPQNKDIQSLPAARDGTRRTYSDELSVQMRDLGPLQGRALSISRTLTRMREENEMLDSIELQGSGRAGQTDNKTNECAIVDSEGYQQGPKLTPAQEHKKAVMQCFLLEMGILFHSIFIGMSLSVSIGSEFIILLIAIIFHQTFEGLALGVRIATIEWPQGAFQPWIMAVAYGCTTPLGQAIGIATHTLYSPDSEVGLLVVGIMNAISAGFLIFASLVELMSEDFLSDESWQVLKGKKRVYACLLVFAGAFLMSLVGAWA